MDSPADKDHLESPFGKLLPQKEVGISSIDSTLECAATSKTVGNPRMEMESGAQMPSSPTSSTGLCIKSPSMEVALGSEEPATLGMEDKPFGKSITELLESPSRLFELSPTGEDVECPFKEGNAEESSESPPHPNLSKKMKSFLTFNQFSPSPNTPSPIPNTSMNVQDPLVQYGSDLSITPTHVLVSGLDIQDSSIQHGCKESCIPLEERVLTPPHLVMSGLPTEEFIDSISMEYMHPLSFPFRKPRLQNRGPHLDESKPSRLFLSIINDVSLEGKKELGKKKGSKKDEKPCSSKKNDKASSVKKEDVTPPNTRPIQKTKKRKTKSSSPKKLEFPSEYPESSTKKRKKSSSKLAGESVKKEEDFNANAEQESANKSGNRAKKVKTRVELVEDSIKEEEEAHPNPAEDKSSDLFDFLYANSVNDDIEDSMVEDFDVFFKMFNPDVDINELVGQGIEYVEPMWEEFLILVEDEAINIKGTQYVHPTSIGNKNSCTRRAIARRIHLMPPTYTLVTQDCPHHKGNCRLVEKLAAFICYLSSLANTEEEKVLDEQFKFQRTATQKKEEEEEDYEEEGIELTADEKKAIRYSSIKELQPVDEDTLGDSDVPLPALPTFKILEKEYILLHDIQVLFNLREDYCLALIAQQMHEEQDWVLQDPILENLNTCFDPDTALKTCFIEANKHKGEIPSEAEFLDTQRLIGDPCKQQLLLESKLKEPQEALRKTNSPIIEEAEDVARTSAKTGEKFIRLWKDELVEEDEQNQVLYCFLSNSI